MSTTVKSLGIDRLALDEKLTLVEEIWDTIARDAAVIPMTVAQRSELEERMAEDESNPDDTIAWEEAKNDTLARLGK